MESKLTGKSYRDGRFILLNNAWVRLFFCFFVSFLFLLFESKVIVYFTFIVALITTGVAIGRSQVSVLLSVLLFLQAVWVVLAFLVYVFDKSPLMLTDTRYTVLQPKFKLITLFVGAQFLTVITACQTKGEQKLYRCEKDHLIARWAAFAVMVLATIFINEGGVILEGGYAGNAAGYWSGLPAIFILAASAWLLLQRNYDLNYVLLLNLVVAWWLFSGNRSEVLIFFLFGNFLFLSNRKLLGQDSKASYVVYAAAVVSVFVIFSLVGNLRVLGVDALNEFSFGSLFFNILDDERLNVQTFGASIYSVITAVYEAELSGLIWGESFLGQLVNTLPSFVPVPWERYEEVSNALREHQIIGGLGLVGEAYLNFGLIGPAVIGVAFAALVRNSARFASSSFFASWFLTSFVLYSPRFILYGFVYLYKLMLIFAVIYFAYSVLRKAVK